jgi:hypothetical protein
MYSLDVSKTRTPRIIDRFWISNHPAFSCHWHCVGYMIHQLILIQYNGVWKKFNFNMAWAFDSWNKYILIKNLKMSIDWDMKHLCYILAYREPGTLYHSRSVVLLWLHIVKFLFICIHWIFYFFFETSEHHCQET